jgi:hypothetical protein
VATFRIIVTFVYLILMVGCAQLKAIFTPTHPPSGSVRPARQTLPPGPAHPARQEPPPRLAPQVSSEREKQLTEEINTTIQKVERSLLSVDQWKLKADQAETYQTVQSFLTQARKALTDKDFQQARNLTQKAHVLSNELSNAVR